MSCRKYTRRDFLRSSAALPAAIFAAQGLVSPSLADALPNAAEAPGPLLPYEPALRDRLWMWGHGPRTTDALYSIPKGNGIDQVDAIRSMGIPNLCVIRWLNSPEPENTEDPTKPPFGEFCKKLTDTKRVAWSIIDGGAQSYEQKKEWGFDLARQMPNLTTLFLDDFFTDIPNGSTITEVKAHLSVDQLKDLRSEMATLPRPVELAAVLYSGQLDPGIRPFLDQCDVVSFWTWAATDLAALEKNFRRYREILPEKRTLLGVYMWDFGNMRPVTPEMMTHQLDFALEMFRKKEIEGFIFHCTPLCDLNLAAVEQSRTWIREHGDEVW